MSRTALRTAAALGAATALTVAGAGVAAATTADSSVDGNTVSVEFALESGDLGDTCGAALVPPTAGLEILENLDTTGGLSGLLTNLDALDGVQVLENGSSPIVSLVPAVSPSGTVSASEVPSGLYGLVTVCLTTMSDPDISVITVGSPLDAIGGLSSEGLLETGSAMLQGGEAGGGLGLDTLSSALGGEAEGELDLAVLSSALGETDAAN
ncbi:hypothetical protein [Dietzia massiliensis]|uniref:hypothetical protein n=1 Tax=Dietzia massiliensis TaxID=2697499 RepID=UPI001BCEF5FD|nr:hypothetical protein [Dietzia massiliensis]MBS7546965.1 hypothetical protein [Dietzia massiliensis]